jgi:hypothetical protein
MNNRTGRIVILVRVRGQIQGLTYVGSEADKFDEGARIFH